MSYNEIHFAKIKLHSSSIEETLNYIKQNNIEDEFDITMNGDTPEYIETIDYKNSKWYSVSGGKYLIEYIYHEESDDEYFEKCITNSDGTLSIAASFYNGGCCWDEVLEELLDKHINNE